VAMEAFNQPTLYQYLDHHPDLELIHDKAMQELTVRMLYQLVKEFPFESVSSVVDIGGGNGHVIKFLLKTVPSIKEAYVLDRKSVCEREQKTNDESRLRFVANDIFGDSYPDCDCYVLKSIVHDTNEENCIKIFKSVINSSLSHPQVTLLVIDRFETAPTPHVLFDGLLQNLFQASHSAYPVDMMKKIIESTGFKHLSTHTFVTGHTMLVCSYSRIIK